MSIEQGINDYEIGEILKVELENPLYFHSRDSFTGSEVELSERPTSNNFPWTQIKEIIAPYAGERKGILKLEYDLIRNEGLSPKKILDLRYSDIRQISKIL
jgi:hypothetical protein